MPSSVTFSPVVPNVNWMAFSLEAPDFFQRIETNGLLRPTVAYLVVVRVIFEPQLGHLGAIKPLFWHPAIGDCSRRPPAWFDNYLMWFH